MLTIKNLTKNYAGNVRALQDICLDVPAGMFGLLGPNGAGKSTLMRTIATLQEPDSGSMHFDGIDVLSEKTALRRQLGYLPQEFGSYPRTSAQAMLEYFASLKGIHGAECREQVEELLVKTNLWELRARSVDKFSGGMKQRFGIAQALLGNPRLLIVDEPTAGLDPAERRRFHNLLAEVGEDVVVILSTHIVDDVAELCPQLAIMGAGRILLQGAPDALTQELQGQLWRRRVHPDAVAALRTSDTVTLISTRIRSGEVEVRLLAQSQPPQAEAVAPELEDVYFATLHRHGLSANLE